MKLTIGPNGEHEHEFRYVGHDRRCRWCDTTPLDVEMLKCQQRLADLERAVAELRGLRGATPGDIVHGSALLGLHLSEAPDRDRPGGAS